ncbi:WD40 repeat-like protein [Mycena venus]|uniref:WD40 repeat-like protein n=1 Tax=Mycena venus TaxID=2733690 RepID=A0A8H6YCH9_9AGAR|nr:WD40 repeat-like protein [Mycena venus]
MKRENARLRLRLSDIESQLLEMESDPTNRRFSTRLKQERQRQLVKEKMSVQESLDLIIYPILSIPVEITSEIFLHCLSPVDAAQPNQKLAPMLLGRICRIWRHIAHSDPRLWAALKIDYYGFGPNALLVQDWLHRAGSVPLSLSLVLRSDHCSFFQHTSCFFPSSTVLTDHWPRLTSFCGENLTLIECLDLLVRAPKLIWCKFIYITGSLRPTSPARALLPDLKDLTVTTRPNLGLHRLLLLLDSLTLPGLRFLSLSCTLRRFDDAPFLSFLQRAPGIQTFALRSISISPEDGDFTTILSAMPALSSLEVHPNSAAVLFNILRKLDESTTFLPRMHKLRFSAFHRVSWEDRFTQTLVDALTSRWETSSGAAQLVDFEFLIQMDPVAGLDPCIVECISKLQEKGMRIYVGPPTWV